MSQTNNSQKEAAEGRRPGLTTAAHTIAARHFTWQQHEPQADGNGRLHDPSAFVGGKEPCSHLPKPHHRTCQTAPTPVIVLSFG